MKDRPFDPHWTTSLSPIVTYMEGLCVAVGKTEARKKRRKAKAQEDFEAAIWAIVLDLYRAHLSDPSLNVGIGLHRNTLQRLSTSQYGSSIFTPTSFNKAMEGLLSGGYIRQTAGFFHDRSGGRSRTRRYQASPSLLSELREAGASAVALTRSRYAVGIRLKNADKKLVEYGQIPFTSKAAKQLSIINDMLQNHWADLALTDEQLAIELSRTGEARDIRAAQPFDFAARTIYRVFNNSDWEQGGRFYGAWWMACPSRLRRYILIDGKRTVEVDYAGLHAAMLYAEAGLTIPEDPYEKCVTTKGSKAERKLVKLAFNALLNADSVAGIDEIDDYDAKLTGRDWRDFKRFIVSSFPEFEKHFGSGVGLRLQRKDSDLAERVMLRFAALGYACLPVHDSFIVHHEMQDVLNSTMKAVFKDMFGVAGETDFDVGLCEAVEASGDPIEANIEDFLSPTGHEGRLQAFREMREQA